MIRAAIFRTAKPIMSRYEPQWPESPAKGEPLTDDERTRLLAIVRDRGEHRTAHDAGVGTQALLRGLAGVGVYAATRSALRTFLARECPERGHK